MSDTMRIAMIDDVQETAETNTEAIKAAIAKAGVTCTVETLQPDRILEIVRLAEGAASIEGASLDGAEGFDKWFGDSTDLNDYDAIFIDYRLRKLEGHPWLTAEDLAGSIRAFGQVPVVVVLNRFDPVDFDLSMIETSTTAADLHMNAKFLASPGLWTPAERWIGLTPNWTPSTFTFRPWRWPSLPDFATDAKQCIEEIVALDADSLHREEILRYLGFGPEDNSLLTTVALEQLDPMTLEPESTTFEQFFINGCVSLQANLRKAMWERIGDGRIKGAICRVVVAELKNWLMTAVLGPGDVLVDFPHLPARMFWLLYGNREDRQVWDSTVSFSERGTLHGIVEKYLFSRRHWLSRSAVWTHRLGANKRVHALLEDDTARPSTKSYVFLEDFSRFVERGDAEPFTSAFDTMWAKRFVSKQAQTEGIRYAPKVRLD